MARKDVLLLQLFGASVVFLIGFQAGSMVHVSRDASWSGGGLFCLNFNNNNNETLHPLMPTSTTTTTSSMLLKQQPQDDNTDDDYDDSSSFDLARTDSDGFFDDISNREWRLLRDKARQMYPNTNGDARRGRMAPGMWFQNHYEPDFACRHERRIGRLGDGGKWVCDPHRIVENKNEEEEKKNKCLVYSVGSNGDASFEAAVQNDISPECEIHIFDFGNYSATVQEQAPGVHYHQWGLGSGGGGGGGRGGRAFKSLQETVQELGHENRVINIFKIDCEGCELTTVAEWFAAKVTLRQVLVEVHSKQKGGNDYVLNPQTMEFFERMYREGYVITHKEPNIAFWRFTKCVEYAFLKLTPDFTGAAALASKES